MKAQPAPVETAITQLLNDYIQQPVQAMREIGLQARLGSLIARSLHPPSCGVRVRDVDSRELDPCHVPGWKVDRVQLEAKVWQADSQTSDRSDLVVFLPDLDVTLTRYPNGVLDIVSRVQAEEVEAVVELKAACTFDEGQRHLFRQDIRKLWDLVPGAPFARHFVLIDKSLSVPLAPALPQRKRAPLAVPVDDWHTEDEVKISETWPPKALDQCWLNSPRPVLHDTAPIKTRFVHVWDLAHGSGMPAVRHRYATFAD